AKERIKDTFGKYMDPRIVSGLIGTSGEHADTAERRTITVFFSDIKSFSSLSEQLTASAMVNLLNAYFTAVTQAIRDHRGIIDKYIGFLSPFGDMTLWNILAFCVVLPYISLYPCMTNWMLWGHILSVAPETASMEGGTRFRLSPGHSLPDSLVTGCHGAAPL